jgi:hypothetical protein
MKVRAALLGASMLGLAAPAVAADFNDGGWRHHHHHGHHQRQFYAEEAPTIVEYREPYLPRGVLYNAPPLPTVYADREARYGDVISARY